MSKFRVVQIQTTPSAEGTHVVVRNPKKRKLFDMHISGVTITITTPLDAEIKVEPDLHRDEERASK